MRYRPASTVPGGNRSGAAAGAEAPSEPSGSRANDRVGGLDAGAREAPHPGQNRPGSWSSRAHEGQRIGLKDYHAAGGESGPGGIVRTAQSSNGFRVMAAMGRRVPQGFLGTQATLAMDSAGKLMVVYNANNSPDVPEQVSVRTSTDESTWSARQQISPAPATVNSGFPMVAAHPTAAGDFRVVWQDDRLQSHTGWNTWYKHQRRLDLGGRRPSFRSDVGSPVQGRQRLRLPVRRLRRDFRRLDRTESCGLGGRDQLHRPRRDLVYARPVSARLGVPGRPAVDRAGRPGIPVHPFGS